MSFEHGAARYRAREKYRCSCDECRDASTARAGSERASRAARLAADPTLAAHGNPSTYSNWGCRCQPCAAANSARCASYKQQAKAGDR